LNRDDDTAAISRQSADVRRIQRATAAFWRGRNRPMAVGATRFHGHRPRSRLAGLIFEIQL